MLGFGRNVTLSPLLLIGMLVLGGVCAGHSRAQSEADESASVAVRSPESANLEETVAPSRFVATVDKLEKTLDTAFQGVVGVLATLLFFSVLGPNYPFPFVVAVLVVGAIVFTVAHGFINFRGFWHGIQLVRGKYAEADDPGDVSHFRALTSALSATVGLGNIAGVAIAITAGGPGAVLWMMFLGLFGMSSKFHECTLGQLFRQFNPDGSVSGGPMHYLDKGLKQKGPAWGVLGKVLAIMSCVMIIGGSLGGGNMFQANQAFSAFHATFIEPPTAVSTEAPTDAASVRAQSPAGAPTVLTEARLARLRVSALFGIALAFLVGLVILGGITRIGAATSRIVPAMCGIYVVASLSIIFFNLGRVPEMIGTIFAGAFNPSAAFGGIVGVMVQGFKRAAFSNEAGLGSAAIAHSAAKTKEPVREGLVALLEPFIDTIVICFMTSMVILITKANLEEGLEGAAVTTFAFRSLSEWFPAILTVCIVLFAYSTMISWCYYGERAWSYLFGFRSLVIFRILFVFFVFFGSIMNLGSVLDFSDLMILCMAFPNIVGGIILIPLVRRHLKDYWSRYRSGQMTPRPDR